jgi:hypothetical protein
MSDNTNTNIALIVIGLIFVVVVYHSYYGNPIKNDGSLQQSSTNYITSFEDSDMSMDDSSCMSSNDQSTTPSSRLSVMNNNSCNQNRFLKSHGNMEYDDSIDIIDERARGRNNLHNSRVNGGKYKVHSYSALEQNMDEVDKQFRVADITQNQTDKFVPLDECAGMGAPISIEQRKDSVKDKHNIDDFLPQEEEKDWFETIENVNVKNSHLINIYRPIGVNTIGNTNRNSSYDIRGDSGAIAPKYVVSPWMQSSYEPNLTQKTLCD